MLAVLAVFFLLLGACARSDSNESTASTTRPVIKADTQPAQPDETTPTASTVSLTPQQQRLQLEIEVTQYIENIRQNLDNPDFPEINDVETVEYWIQRLTAEKDQIDTQNESYSDLSTGLFDFQERLLRAIPPFKVRERELKPVPEHIDPRIHYLWYKYGPGPDCEERAPNWSRNACYQYQIGPGEPDPVVAPVYTFSRFRFKTTYDDEGNELPTRVIQSPEASCAEPRVDPTWVNEGLVPYFHIDEKYENFKFGENPLNVNSKNYNEFIAYLVALSTVDKRRAEAVTPANPSWENCLNVALNTCCTLRDIEDELAPTVELLVGGWKLNHIDLSEKGYYVYIHSVNKYGGGIASLCYGNGRKVDPRNGGYRNGEQIFQWTEEFPEGNIYYTNDFKYHTDSATLELSSYLTGRHRNYRQTNLSAPLFEKQSLFVTGSCEEEAKLLIKGFQGRLDQQWAIENEYTPVNRWFYIPVEASDEYRTNTISDTHSAVACLVDADVDDIYPDHIPNDNVIEQRDCDELRASGKLDNIFNLAPSTDTRDTSIYPDYEDYLATLAREKAQEG